MKSEDEKKPQEERRQDIEPENGNGNQGTGNKNGEDGNPVEMSKKRQRKELRKTAGGEAAEDGRNPRLGERIREEIRNDIEAARQEISEAKKAFTQRKPEVQPTGVNGGVPVQGIQGGGYSTPEDAPDGAAEPSEAAPQGQADVNAQAQPDEVQPDSFEEPGSDAGQGQGPAQGQSPTLPQRVNEKYKDLAAGVAPTDSAGVSGTEKTSSEESRKTEQEKKELTEPARQMAEYNNAVMEQAGRDLAAAQEKYGVTNVQEAIDGKLKEAEAKKGSPLTARERRKITRETEREQEARIDKIYRELDPNYKDSKAFRREQNIKTIIGAIGQLGKMAGQAFTAANSGIIIPTRSFSEGIMNDIRISNREREQLLKAYDSIRQAKMNEPLQRLQDAEKKQLDLIKSAASYQTGKTTDLNKNASGQEMKVEKKKEKIDYKDWLESRGGAKGMFGKLQNGEYVIPDIYRNGRPTGAHKVTVDVFNNATGNLFDVFRKLPGINTNKAGDVEDANGNIWVDLHQLQEEIAGATEAGTREKLQQRYIEYLDKMLKFMEKSDSEEAKQALDDYSRLLKDASIDYRAYGGDGENAGGQPGTFNQAAVNALQNI